MSPVSGSRRRCSSGAPSVSWTSRKRMVLLSVAVWSLIGTLTSPKVMVALKTLRGAMGP